MKKEKKSRPKYNMWQNSWFMIRLAWDSQEKKVLVLGLLSALLAVLTNLVELYISPAILAVLERHAPVRELILTILGFVLAVMAVAAASAYVNANNNYGKITVRFEIVNLLNRKAATTSYPNVDDEKFRNLLMKSADCTNRNSAATEAVWGTLTSLTKNILGFAIYVSLLSAVQPVLILVSLGTTLGSYFIGNYVNGYGYRHRDEEAELNKHMSYLQYCARDFEYAKDTRIFGLKPWLEELFNKAMDTYTAFQKRAQSVYIWAKIADLFFSFLRNGAAYFWLIGLVIRNELGAADFLLFFTAAGGFSQWVSGILGGFNTLYRQSLDLCTVRECLDYREPFRMEGGDPIDAEADKKYELRLSNVSFRYPGAKKDTLTRINLTLHPGEKLAVVGLNGAGKTTLMKLLCGLLDPTEGQVLLDGKDIREFNRREYYTLFSAVFQNFSLLAGTIAANIAQREEEIDPERIKECLRKAGLEDKVSTLPDGVDTYLNREIYEGAVLLSGGEMQRLMLARALYKNAPFVFLDEPTAALDPIAESDMYQKYNEMTSGKSSVYISHRLASTRFCDRIVLIENAGISEEGTHEELMKKGGRYAELFAVQSNYYKTQKTEGNINESVMCADLISENMEGR